MFNPTRSLQSTQSLPLLPTPLSPPDESTSHMDNGDSNVLDGIGGGWVQTMGHKRALSSMSGMEGFGIGDGLGGMRGDGLMGPPMLEPPRTVERKRKGRMVDVINFLPTPPRTKDTRLDPTPTQSSTSSTGSSSKRRGKITTNFLPTPTTDEIITLDPTFSFNSDEWVKMGRSGGGGIWGMGRRRPGLTFAQQMAAAVSSTTTSSTTTTSATGETKIHGVGVGMGGYRLHPFTMRDDVSTNVFGGGGGGGKKKLLGAAPIEDLDGGNPFLASPSGIGGGLADDVEMGLGLGTPLESGVGGGTMMGTMIDSILSPSSVMTSPPTESINIGSPLTPTGELVQRDPPKVGKKKWAPPVVGEEEGNPFLAPKGTKVIPRLKETEWEEKETVTYVFRGTKTTFANPYYKVSTGETSTSRLPTSHPDFSPPPAPRPRLLWPSGNEDDVDMDDDNDMASSSKPRLLFASTIGVKRGVEEEEEREGKRMKHCSMKSGTFEMGGGGLRM